MHLPGPSVFNDSDKARINKPMKKIIATALLVMSLSGCALSGPKLTRAEIDRVNADLSHIEESPSASPNPPSPADVAARAPISPPPAVAPAARMTAQEPAEPISKMAMNARRVREEALQRNRNKTGTTADLMTPVLDKVITQQEFLDKAKQEAEATLTPVNDPFAPKMAVLFRLHSLSIGGATGDGITITAHKDGKVLAKIAATRSVPDKPWDFWVNTVGVFIKEDFEFPIQVNLYNSMCQANYVFEIRSPTDFNFVSSSAPQM